MLARLQQTILLALLAAAGAWATVFSLAGWPLVAALGAVAILCGYSLVLGLEFAMLRVVNRSDPAPLASWGQLLRAWWGETRTAAQVFGWRQPFRAGAYADWLPQPASTRRGVVLVHGFVCNRGFWNPWMKHLRAEGVPHVAVNLEPVFASIDDYSQIIEDAVERIATTTGRAPVVVAHSMGGLAVRAWLGRFDGAGRAHRFITIGTPHRGTWLARFAYAPNARQMKLNCEWQQMLSNTQAAAAQARFTCFYSHCDNIVFPSSNATLPGADNRHVPGVAHVELAFQDQVFKEVLRWVDAAQPSRP